MPRHPEPESLKQWREWCANPPRVCANCDYYSAAGVCAEYDAEPPLAFAQAPGACDKWEHEIPF